MTDRVCKVCGVAKPASDYIDSNASTCRECLARRATLHKGASREKFLRALHSNARSSCKRTGRAEYHLTLEDVEGLWRSQGGRCALSGVYMTHHRDGEGHVDLNASLDRILPSGPYTRDNVRLVCQRVNLMRHTLREPEFWWWVKNLAAHAAEVDNE